MPQCDTCGKDLNGDKCSGCTKSQDDCDCKPIPEERLKDPVSKGR